MAEDSLRLCREQLQARLQYYRELGIESLAIQWTPESHFAGNLNSLPFFASRDSLRDSASDARSEAAIPNGSDFQRVGNLSLFETHASDQTPAESLETIRADLGDCRRCKLCSTRTHIVFGSGTPEAKLVFVGEGPGADEDAQGLPFVGKAGQLLTKIIEAIQLKRDQVYICNVVKCRPPGNRFPEEEEIAACSPFLARQIASIRPSVICCLGTAAAQTILSTKTSIGKLRGRFHDYHGIAVLPTYHPSYLLRYPDAKRDVWEDMKKIRAFLNDLS
jgi:uracil-DNA glycosylase